MGKKFEEEKQVKPEISISDIQTLQNHLKDFEQKEMQGRLVSRFDQWCLFTGICKLVNGEWIVSDSTQYDYWLQVEERRKSYEWATMGEMARETTVMKIRKMIEEAKGMFAPKKMPQVEEELIPF